MKIHLVFHVNSVDFKKFNSKEMFNATLLYTNLLNILKPIENKKYINSPRIIHELVELLNIDVKRMYDWSFHSLICIIEEDMNNIWRGVCNEIHLDVIKASIDYIKPVELFDCLNIIMKLVEEIHCEICNGTKFYHEDDYGGYGGSLPCPKCTNKT